MNDDVVRAQLLINTIEECTDDLKSIATRINPNKPWKRVLREDLGLVI